MPTDPLKLFQRQPSQSSLTLKIEDDLCLHYRQDLPGQLIAADGFSHHLITFFLTDNSRQITQIDSCGEYDGQMQQGEFYLYPAQASGFTDWQAKDKTLHLIIQPNLLRKIAIKTASLNPDRIELMPILKQHDDRIEQLAQLFLTEMQNQEFGSQLYLESLSNLLGVHLLRNYCTFKPKFRTYADGLSNYKLRQAIDYIQSNLDKKLSLETMANQVNMSKYYFATQFKQAMGVSPYQYAIAQRLAKAKQLLKKGKHTLSEIALDCGFASQSHFNQVFRQHVGTTPKRYQQNQ
ncbi:MAG: AraC family transcriptional regulator [Cyanobacteria bacterium J06600_6]